MCTDVVKTGVEDSEKTTVLGLIQSSGEFIPVLTFTPSNLGDSAKIHNYFVSSLG